MNNGTPKPPRWTLNEVLAWMRDSKTSDSERQALKAAIQQHQNSKFGDVAQHIVHERRMK